MEKKRLIWADSLKGVLIILVVLGHAIQAGMGDAAEINHLWNAIYSFHMAAFMGVSGFLAFHSPTKVKDVALGKSIVRRFRQLIIPFVLWTIISILIYSDFHLSIDLISVFFANCILYPHKGFWFLWVLFFINVFFVFGNWLSVKRKISQDLIILFIGVLLVWIMIVFEPRLFGFQFISFYFLFYSLGYYIHKYEDIIIRCNWVVIVPLVFCWCILAWFWQMHELPVWLRGTPLPESFLQYAYRFITAAIAIYIFLAVSPGILNRRSFLNISLVELGQYSLGIYTCHMMIVGKLTYFFKGCGLNDIIVIACTFITALLISWLVVWSLSKWRLTAQYTLGKI